MNGNNINNSNSGLVGVNVTTPLSQFHVYGDVRFGDTIPDPIYGKVHFSQNRGSFKVGGFDYGRSGTWGMDSTGTFSFTAGVNNIAASSYSTAIGRSNTATLGTAIFTAGQYNRVSGGVGIALGSNNTVTLSYGSAIGSGNTVTAQYASTIGRGLNANGYSEVVVGQFNELIAISPNGDHLYDPIFEVGMGINNANRKNALTVIKTGYIGIGTTDPHEMVEVSDTGLLALRMTSTDNDRPALELFRPGTINYDWRIVNEGGALRYYVAYDIENDLPSNIISFTSTGIYPGVNDAYDIGSSTLRWDDIYATSGVVNTSDARNKQNIAPLNYGLKTVMQLNPVSYQWKESRDQNTKIGLLAQDLLQVIPEVVKTHDWIQNGDGEAVYQELDRYGVYYSDLIPVLIKAIQEQQQQIDILQQQVDQLISK